MHRQTLLIAALILLAPAAALPQDTDSQIGLHTNDAALRAFTHARIVPRPGEVIEDGTLVVRDGIVVSVEANGAVPEGAEVIDLSGMTVYAGFVEPYSDYGLKAVPESSPSSSGQGPNYFTERVGANSWNGAVHPEVHWVDHFAPDPEGAKSLLERGVTSVQAVHKDGIFRGMGFAASLHGALSNETILDPATRHFASFDPGSSPQSYPSSLMGSIALVRQTLYDAAWYRDAHTAWERRPGQEAPETNRALAELSAYTGPLVFETEDALSLLRAGRISSELQRPLIHVGSGGEYAWIEEIAELAQPILLPATLPSEPEVGSYEQAMTVSLADLRHWEKAPTNAASLAAADIQFALTSHGLRDDENLLDNVGTMIEHGLDADRALAALTTVPAELVGLGDRVGTIDAGRRADLVVVDGDLFDGGSIESTWVGGRAAWRSADSATENFDGAYQVLVDGVEYTVEVAGGAVSPKVTWTDPNDEEFEGEGTTIEGGRLHSRVQLEQGVVRLTAFRLDQQMRGQLTTPDGGLHTLVLTPTDGSEEPPDDEADAADPTPPSYLAARTYPDVAYGFQAVPAAEEVVVRNATVWTGAEAGVLENADLHVKDGTIVAIGNDLDVPSSAREIDATGRHLTAGMIDEHAHIAIQGGVNEGSHEVTSEVRIGDVVDPTDIDIYRALAGGTTTAQLLHGSANPIGGQAQVIKLRWGQGPEEMKFASAPPSIKFALGENVKQSNWGDAFIVRYPQTRMGVEAVMRDRFLAARDYADDWSEWEGLSSTHRSQRVPPRRDLQLEALAEILASERFVHCHSYVQSEILMLMRLAEELGFRIKTFTHILEGYKVAPEMAAHGAGASTFSDWWAYKFEVYDAIPQNTCLMHDAGVVTSINSDSSDLIRRLNTEAGKSVLHCGMEERDALRMATLNPARQLGIDDRVGSLEPGKDADFVIWNGHPLSMHTRAEQTWIDGALYFDRERDDELRRRVTEEREALIQKILADDGTEADEADDGEGAETADDSDAPGRQRHRYDCEDQEDYWHARTHP